MNSLLSSSAAKQAAENTSASRSNKTANKQTKTKTQEIGQDEHKLKKRKSVHGVAVCSPSSVSITSSCLRVCWFFIFFLETNYSLETGVNTPPAEGSSCQLSIMWFPAEINRSGSSSYTAAQPVPGSAFGSRLGSADLLESRFTAPDVLNRVHDESSSKTQALFECQFPRRI